MSPAIAWAGSPEALEANAFQTTAYWWRSLTTLAGIGLNAVFGWWWGYAWGDSWMSPEGGQLLTIVVTPRT